MGDYYVLQTNGQAEGPFDFVAIVRKIKKNALGKDTVVRLPDGQEIHAGDVPELQEFFVEHEQLHTQAQFATNGERVYQLRPLLERGWDFVLQNNVVLIYAGVFLILSGLAFGILHGIPGIGDVLAFTLSYVLLGGVACAALRKARGQALEPAQVTDIVREKGKELSIVGFILAIPFAIGIYTLVLLIIPLAAMTLYAFTPFLLIERNISGWDAMEISRKRVMKMDMNNIAIILALMLMNAVGGFTMILLLITLPMSLYILAEMYDEIFVDI